MSGEGRRRSKHFHRHKKFTLKNDASLVFDLRLHPMAEHAFAGVIEMPKSLMQTMTYLARNYGRRDNLGVRVLQAGASIRAMVLENGYVVDALVRTERVVSFLEYS